MKWCRFLCFLSALSIRVHAEDIFLFVDFNQLQGRNDVEILAAKKVASRLGLSFKSVPSEQELRTFLLSNQGKIKSFVISGHCSGSTFIESGRCGVSRREIGNLLKTYPETFGEVENVMGLGCYSLNGTTASHWKGIFPKLKNIGGFCGKGPIGQASADYIENFYSHVNTLTPLDGAPVSEEKYSQVRKILRDNLVK